MHDPTFDKFCNTLVLYDTNNNDSDWSKNYANSYVFGCNSRLLPPQIV